MEHLVLGLLLLAGTLAAGNPLHQRDLQVDKETKMDMAPNSFDDQYSGCNTSMWNLLGNLNRTEFANNSIYAEAWTLASKEWGKKGLPVPSLTGMKTEHAVAIMAYTLDTPLYSTFNAAVREAGKSRQEYRNKFQFKVLHFLLTQALTILRNAQPFCYDVYRGIRGIHFTAQQNDPVRFGQFTSSSLNSTVAKRFGQDTFFMVHTCYGVPVANFSDFPTEEEVLIPPYEKFQVTNITKSQNKTDIKLISQGTFSKYNCELLKG
ncbi:NRT2 ribosyltransferase, partial [Thinocorus orbignyianus]|nr:NRT2 ribosyltransferase [Thinocorus orbignyianus]